jgi:hypothetical protein
LSDSKFAAKAATVSCGLHNTCERYECPYEGDFLRDLDEFRKAWQPADWDDVEILESASNNGMALLIGYASIWIHEV